MVSYEVPLLEDKMACLRNMPKRTILPIRREIILAMNTLKWSKAAEFDDLL